MSNFAVVFPGQGSQALGMLSEMASRSEVVERTFSIASNSLGYDAWELVQTDPESKLDQTEYTQPALLTASVALWEVWKSQGGRLPQYFAGHSLGEYSALVCAGSLTFEDAVQLVSNRGRFMQEAVAEGEGAMAAVIGLDDERVFALCEEAAEGRVLAPANLNSIGQIVVSGNAAAVERLIQLAEKAGARMAIKIPVSVPSHCDLMKPAALRLEQSLAAIEIRQPAVPVVFNVDAKVHENPDEIRRVLLRQLYLPVRWVEIIQFIASQGVEKIIECGAGKVLAGLNKRIVRKLPTVGIDKPDTLENSLIT